MLAWCFWSLCLSHNFSVVLLAVFTRRRKNRRLTICSPNIKARRTSHLVLASWIYIKKDRQILNAKGLEPVLAASGLVARHRRHFNYPQNNTPSFVPLPFEVKIRPFVHLVWSKVGFRRLVRLEDKVILRKTVSPDGQMDGQIQTTCSSKLVFVPSSHKRTWKEDLSVF